MNSSTVYDLQTPKLPHLSGTVLDLFVRLIENRFTRGLLIDSMLKQAGIMSLRALEPDDPPTFLPLHPVVSEPGEPINMERFLETPRIRQKGYAFETVEDYAEAYRRGNKTPEQVADCVLMAIAESDAHDPPLRAFIAYQREDVMEQARASAQRHRQGKPISVFDGVPVAIKDEFDMVPYPTTVGTRVLGRKAAREDSTVAARMRAAGALLIGKTNMHEIGVGVTGLNPNSGTARNPYNLAYHTGGSSSGSAASVAAGLCPVASGADAGGSIRIPSSLCGLVGLKPTYGRVSTFGGAPLAWSLDHYGAIAATARDAALAYAVIAGPDPKDSTSLTQPRPTLENFENVDLHGLRLGTFPAWFRDSSPVMQNQCNELLKGLSSLGAQVVPVEIPELEAARIAQLVIIITEMMTALERYYPDHHKEFGLDVRANLALGRTLNARDYVKAQRIRTRVMRHFNTALAQVDAIISPSTGRTAPPISPAALSKGESDLTTLGELMRFSVPANMTGLPAISFPAGYNGDGLPIGIQAIGRPWQEHVLLRLANAAEQFVVRRAPQLHYKILS